MPSFSGVDYPDGRLTKYRFIFKRRYRRHNRLFSTKWLHRGSLAFSTAVFSGWRWDRRGFHETGLRRGMIRRKLPVTWQSGQEFTYCLDTFDGLIGTTLTVPRWRGYAPDGAEALEKFIMTDW